MSRRCPTRIEADPVLSALWRYWDEKRVARVMPRRRDLDPPLEIPRLLPHLLLVERADGRFRWRLAGTAVVDAYGQELTGRFIDEVISAARYHAAHRHYATVFETTRPIFVRNRYTNRNATDFVVSRIILPLCSEDQEAVRLLLQAQTFRLESTCPAQLGTSFTIDANVDEIEFLDEMSP